MVPEVKYSAVIASNMAVVERVPAIVEPVYRPTDAPNGKRKRDHES
jgi:hypothetical protein